MAEAYKPVRTFSANVGDYSVNEAGPDAIEDDFDSIVRMFDPETEHAGGVPGGIGTGNIQEGAVTDAIIGERTIDQNISEAYNNTGLTSKLLSLLAKTIKALKGTSDWHSPTSDTIEGIHGRVSSNNAGLTDVTNGLAAHKTGGDHDSRYYKKSETDATVATLATKTENAFKANSIDVYTRTELEPYLRGGETIIRREVYIIVNSDNGDGTFTYKDGEGNEFTGDVGNSGEQIFKLRKGHYDLGQERAEITVNDTLQRSVGSGGLEEVDETHVALTMPEGDGAEITIKYFEKLALAGTGYVQRSANKPTIGVYWFKVVE